LQRIYEEVRSPLMADLFENPAGLDGFEFIEFSAPEKGVLEPVFEVMGFTKIARHRSKDVELWRQGGINLITNYEPNTPAWYFSREHGPSACECLRHGLSRERRCQSLCAFTQTGWADFYEQLFNFQEIRYFDIKGEYTGLTSKALTAPDGKIRIPLNEEGRRIPAGI